MKKSIWYIILIVFVCMFLACDTELFTSGFKNIDVKNNANIKNDTEDDYILTAPQNLIVSKAESTNSITLSWNKVKNAEYYHIYRRKLGEEEFIPILEDVEGTIYTDISTLASPLESDVRYEYKVCALNRGVFINEEDVKFSNTASGSLLSSPKNIKVAKGEDENYILVTWDTSLDASKYKLYVSLTDSFSGSDCYKADIIPQPGLTQSKRYYLGDESKSKAGVSLYFKVTSVSKSGVETDLSNSKYDIGYTKVQGAPEAPNNLVGEQGVRISTSTGGLQLSWGYVEDVDYIIYRSSEKQDQKQVFPFTEDTSELVKDEVNGTVTYTDKYGKNDIKVGERYTYTVIPVSKITTDGEEKEVQGVPATVDAYLLSNPSSISVKAQREPKGYLVEFPSIVGLDTEEDIEKHPDWRYVLVVNDNNVIKEISINSKTENTESVSYLYSVDEAGTNNVTFKLYVTNGSVTTEPTDEFVCSVPSKIRSFSVTKNTYISNTSPNSNGVYPVKLTWGKDVNAFEYVIERYREGEVEDKEAIATLDGSITSYVDNNPNAKAGEKYYYSIYALDALGRKGTELSESERQVGYGVLTAEKYIEYWSIYCFKPFVWFNNLSTTASTDEGVKDLKNYWKNTEIASKVEKGNASSLTDQLGALTSGNYIYSNCHYYHGTHTTNFGRLGYSADTEGVGGQIYFSYEDFGELPWMFCNGSYEMHVNSSGTGNARSSSNGFSVGGMYPGKIKLDNVTVVNKAFSGNYLLVLEDGRGTVSVPSI